MVYKLLNYISILYTLCIYLCALPVYIVITCPQLILISHTDLLHYCTTCLHYSLFSFIYSKFYCYF